MIPILFPSTATDFSTRGLGPLSDCISCTVTEQRNGIYELEMQYPLAGRHYEDITDRSIILAIPSPYRAAQPFRVYQITRSMGGTATIYAQHLSYDLAGIPVEPFSQDSLAMALTWLKTHSAIDNPFSFSADFSSSADFGFLVPTTCRSLLGGVEGSILDVYGGEYEFDGYDVVLHRQRGGDNGVTIRYGKNLTDLSQDISTADLVTGIYPYWQNSETGDLVTCSPAVVSASGTYDFQQVIPVDFTADFEEQPTPEQLQDRAEQYISDNSIGVPTVSTTVSFVQLEQMSGYEDLALLERCDLCDTVTVEYPALGVSAKAKIVTVVTDVLLERYNSMEIGSVRANVAQTIGDQQNAIDSQQQEVDKINETFPSRWQQSMYELAQKITGQNDSHVIFSPMEYPAVIIITENTDLTAAGNSALYLSSAGLAGTDDLAAALQNPSLFRTAITIDGHIIGERITGLEIQGDQIVGGIIKNDDGTVRINLTTGDAYVPRLLGRTTDGGTWVGIEQGQLNLSGAQYNGVRYYTQSSANGAQTDYLYVLRNNTGVYLIPASAYDGPRCVLDLAAPSSDQSSQRIFSVRRSLDLGQMFYVTSDGNAAIAGEFFVMGHGGQLVDTSGALTIKKDAQILFQDSSGKTYFAINPNNVAGVYTDYDIETAQNIIASTVQAGSIHLKGDTRAAFRQVNVTSTSSDYALTFPSGAAFYLGTMEGASSTVTWAYQIDTSGQMVMGNNLNMNGHSVLNSSDKRLKKYITDSKEKALPILEAIPMRQYTYKKGAPEALSEKKVRFGEVAQELAEVYPEAVVHDEEKDAWYIDKIALIDPLIKAVQELSEKVKSLETKISERKETVNASSG